MALKTPYGREYIDLAGSTNGPNHTSVGAMRSKLSIRNIFAAIFLLRATPLKVYIDSPVF